MTGTLLLSLSWLLQLGSFLSLISLLCSLIWLKRRGSVPSLKKLRISTPSDWASFGRTVKERLKNWPLIVADSERVIGGMAILLAMFTAGYGTREYQESKYQSNVLTNVRILSRLPPSSPKISSEYWVQIPPADPYQIKFCADSPTDLDPGMTLDLLVYEERGVCKGLTGEGDRFKVRRNIATGKFISFMEE